MDLCSSILSILEAAGERVCSNERLMVFLFSLEPPDTEDLDTFAAPEQGDQQLMCRTVHAQDWRELVDDTLR